MPLFLLLFSECEHLIRHMLVKDPNQRYTIEQIKKHKWMQADPAVKNILADNAEANFEGDKILEEYNEQALELMQGLGIDIERTKTVNTDDCRRLVLNSLKLNSLWGRAQMKSNQIDTYQIILVFEERGKPWYQYAINELRGRLGVMSLKRLTVYEAT